MPRRGLVRSSQAKTPLHGEAGGLLAGRYRTRLAEARRRTLALVDEVCPEDLDRQHNELMSPVARDLGHIAAFEDLWLCQRAGGLPALRPDLEDVYDAAEPPRAHRDAIPYLPCAEARELMAAVRERALWVLDRADLSDASDPLNADGFVWEMVVEHEHQHCETILQALKLAPAGVCTPKRPGHHRPAAAEGPEMVRVEAGPFPLGEEGEGFAYDNERPRQFVDLPAFEIDRTPVTNGAYREWIDAGGYSRRECWSEEGWAWLR